MRKNTLFLLMLPLFFMTADIHAQRWESEHCSYVDETNFYAKIFAGSNFLQSTVRDGNKFTYQTGYMISGSLGYCGHYNLCLEGEYAFRRNAIKKIHFFGQGSSKHGYFQTSSYMANLLWNLPLSLWGCSFWNMQPFIGAGVGYDFQHMHASNCRIIFDQRWKHFAWQMMGGLSYSIFCNAEITLEYKFHQGGCHFDNHVIGIGLIYKFDGLR